MRKAEQEAARAWQAVSDEAEKVARLEEDATRAQGELHRLRGELSSPGTYDDNVRDLRDRAERLAQQAATAASEVTAKTAQVNALEARAEAGRLVDQRQEEEITRLKASQAEWEKQNHSLHSQLVAEKTRSAASQGDCGGQGRL